MRQLLLMRHAKSAWDDPTLADIERPLARRGRLAARLMGAWLAENDLIPDHAIVSPAVRAAQTLAQASRGAGAAIPCETAEALYPGDPDAILGVLQGAPEGARRLMLIGHQPGFGDFARLLASLAGADPIGKFPTASIALMALDGDWRSARFGAARLVEFVRPRDLV